MRSFTWLGVIAVVVSIVSIGYLSVVSNLWIDEMHTLNTVYRPLSDVGARAIDYELQAPLYFMVLAIWARLHDSVWFLRLLSGVAAALSLSVLWKLSRRHGSRTSAWMALTSVALNPFLVWAGAEMRVYALAIALALVLVLLFDFAFPVTPGTTHQRVAATSLLGVAAIASLYTHYYLGFFLLAFGIMLLVERRWSDLGLYALTMTIVGAVFLPIALLVPGQVLPGVPDQSQTFGAMVLGGVRRMEAYLLPVDSLPRWARYGTRAVALLLGALAARRVIGAGWREALEDTWFRRLLVLLATSLGAWVFVRLYAGAFSAQSRHTYFVFVSLILLWSHGIHLMNRVSARSVAICASLVALALTAHETMRIVAAPQKLGDAARVANEIERSSSAPTTVLTFPREMSMALEHYLDPGFEVRMVPDISLEAAYSIEDNFIHSIDAVRSVVYRGDSAPESLWYYTYSPRRYDGYEQGRAILEDYLFSNYRTESSQTFVQAELFFLVRGGAGNE